MSLALNIAAITISLAAVALSAFFGLRQLRSMQKSNSTMVTIELLTRECRSNDFLESEEFVLYELSSSPPEDGLSGLPPKHRRHVTRIGLFFSSLGALSALGGVETRMITAMVPSRARRAWLALEPYIILERKLRSPTYLSFFEHLVCLINDTDPAKHHESLGLRKLESISVQPRTDSGAVGPPTRPAKERDAAH
ncbi:hypothetical protein V6V47_20495 [Micromonospora sp. CPCC 205539]|uniref:DUF4760 domain-containing protein n=1 Tax=Micromonospora sp. CPCC 205539 TaxID=3122408 RepID=UPI002FF0E16F